MRRSWSRGTARPPWRSPTAGSSAPRSTATACGPRATWSPTTASCCSPPRWAACTFPKDKIRHKWRLQPGKMLLIDLEQKRIISDEELKQTLAAAHPYEEWLKRTQVVLRDLPTARTRRPKITVPLLDRQQAFGYTQEDLKLLMAPMAQTGQEAVGSMGNDAPISALSDKPKLLDTYFKQNFAQVTNPPIDPIREELVMSLVSFIGPRPNLLDLKGTSTPHAARSRPADSDQRGAGAHPHHRHGAATIPSAPPPSTSPTMSPTGPNTWTRRSIRVCALAQRAVSDGYNIIILSDRAVSAERVPIPALLATSATHHHLIRSGLRTSVGLVVELGEPREVHQFCALAGYGAEAINPYLAFETLDDMLPELEEKITAAEAVKRYIKAIDKGILKVMSKMGISTYQSYCGAQIFDAVGLASGFVAQVFHRHGHPDRRHRACRDRRRSLPPSPGRVRLRSGAARTRSRSAATMPTALRGEAHVWSPEAVSNLQHAVRGNSQAKYRAFARHINEQSERLRTMRGLFRIRSAGGDGQQADRHRRGRAGQQHRQALFDRRHVLRLDQPRGAHDAGHRHEPHRRQVEHRRRRRGGGSLRAAAQWRFHALGDQAGGFGPLRRDRRISRQLRHDADQDGAGRQARRRRAAARPQGRCHHRQGAPFDAGRRVLSRRRRITTSIRSKIWPS